MLVHASRLSNRVTYKTVWTLLQVSYFPNYILLPEERLAAIRYGHLSKIASKRIGYMKSVCFECTIIKKQVVVSGTISIVNILKEGVLQLRDESLIP